ncbi:MAG: putative metal-dependent hydrolase [Bacteroidia bacterium]|nr:putative metal-dependent hydrolase [Bacteroidia bacterium]
MSADILRYPIGKFSVPEQITEEKINHWIEIIESLPLKMREAVNGLTADQLDCPYREGGWTLRQVVHHVADSHMNAYIRFKLALTEDNPSIKPYQEEKWAELPEARHGQIEISLKILEALHTRWTHVLRNMYSTDWHRTYYHPENKKTTSLGHALGLYAWHSEHHVAHVTNLRKFKNW